MADLEHADSEKEDDGSDKFWLSVVLIIGKAVHISCGKDEWVRVLGLINSGAKVVDIRSEDGIDSGFMVERCVMLQFLTDAQYQAGKSESDARSKVLR